MAEWGGQKMREAGEGVRERTWAGRGRIRSGF